MKWTNRDNERRCDLIDKEINHTITEAERIEFDGLQKRMLVYRRKVAPLPMPIIQTIDGVLRITNGTFSETTGADDEPNIQGQQGDLV